MPRYFFDLTMDDDLYPDTVGVEGPDATAMRREALNALSEMARDAIRVGGDRRDLHMDVRDADRQIIFTACVALRARWLD